MLAVGSRVSHYRILEELGGGGMGVVYRAEDMRLQREVALKFLPPELTRDPEAKERFIHEARAASSLDHTNLCIIHDIDESDDGRLFICMAYYEGESLKEKLARGPLPAAEALVVTRQVARGLVRAHEAGIIHRDIKPANIVVTDRGVVKIVDFGLAKLAGGTRITRTGITLGTVAYMSPEQARGTAVDARADIWSLGVVMYEMLAGKLPFGGDYEQAVFYSILNEDPPPLSGAITGVSRELERVVRSCLVKDPARRCPSAEHLLAELDRIEAGRPVTTRTRWRSGAGRVMRPLAHRLKLVLPLVLTLGIIGLVLFPGGRQRLMTWLGMERLPAVRHVAVGPFMTRNGSPDDVAFGDGLAVSLGRKLGQLVPYADDFWVVPEKDLVDAGGVGPVGVRKMVGATLLLNGELVRTGRTVHLRIRLTDTRTRRVLRYRDLEDNPAGVTTFRDEVLHETAGMLDVAVDDRVERALNQGETAWPGAYNFYLIGLGYLSPGQGDRQPQRAVRQFDKAIELDPNYALAWAARGEAHWEWYRQERSPDRLDAAIRDCRQALEIDQQLAPVYEALGEIQLGAGRPDEAIKDLERALQINPEYYEACLVLAKAYQKAGHTIEAEETCRRAIQLRPDYYAGHNQLGYFYYRLSRNGDAVAEYRRVLKLAPGNVKVLYNLIALFYLVGDVDASRSAFDQARAAAPDQPKSYVNMGTVYFYTGDYTRALAMYNEALRLGGVGEQDYALWANVGDCRRRVPGNGAAAREAYGKALAVVRQRLAERPDDAGLLARLAYLRVVTGEGEPAVRDMDRARTLDPNNVEVLYKGVVVYELAGARDQAIRALQDYLERQGPLPRVLDDPDLADLRQDARVRELLRRSDGTAAGGGESED